MRGSLDKYHGGLESQPKVNSDRGIYETYNKVRKRSIKQYKVLTRGKFIFITQYGRLPVTPNCMHREINTP